MSPRALNTIRALYGSELDASKRRGILAPIKNRLNPLAKGKEKQLLELYGVRWQMVNKLYLLLAVVAVFVFIHLYGGVYYYNKLMRIKQDILKEGAKIESLLQRRRNITASLTQAVHDYAVHEKGIFDHVSDMRMSSKLLKAKDGQSALTDADSLQQMLNKPNSINQLMSIVEDSKLGKQAVEGKLAGLLAIAERYPDLKLSDNFRRLMEALIETEKDICTERMTYIEVTNEYSTILMTFPGNLFGWAFGFEEIPYYKADNEARRFNPLKELTDP